MALEIALGRDVVVLREERRLVLADGVLDLVGRPDVELALLALRLASSEAQNAPSSVVISRASQPTVSCARIRNSELPERPCASASNSRSCALS